MATTMLKPMPKNRVSPKVRNLRADVQGLRAFAVLAVLLAHTTGWPSGGFVGVDVFFVISGFLITGHLLREHERTGSISFADFYRKRAKRILPASITVLVATVLAAYFLLPRNRAASTLLDGVWSFVFAGNWRFASSGTDYFQEGTLPSPLQHFWSLGVEEQFYFVWPVVMLAIFWLTAKRLGGYGTSRSAAALGLCILMAASFAWATWETTNNPTVAYFSTLSRGWELGAGALLAVVSPLVRLNASVRTVFAWAGLLGLFYSVFTVSSDAGFPAPWAALPVAATALIIMSGTGGDAKFLWPLTNRVSQYIGDISYSLYLWHWPVVVLLVAVLPSATPLYWAASIGLSLVLSVMSFHWVEQPFRKAKEAGPRGNKSSQRTPLRQRLPLVGLIATAAATAVVVPISLTQHRSDPAAGISAAQSAPSSSHAPAATCLGAASLVSTVDCTDTLKGVGLAPSVEGLADDTGNAFECWIAEGEAAESCSFGSKDSAALKIALVGDSHAASLIPALTPALEANNWHMDTYVGFGCQWKMNPGECSGPLNEFEERVSTPGAYDVVITTASRSKTGDNKEAAAIRFSQAWSPVVQSGVKVVVVADVPGVSKQALECINRVTFDPHDNDCATPEAEALIDADALVAAHEVTGDSKIVSVNDLLCRDGSCPAVIGNVVVYRDSAGHLSATFAQTLAPILSERIRAALA